VALIGFAVMTHYILIYRQPVFLKVKARKTRLQAFFLSGMM